MGSIQTFGPVKLFVGVLVSEENLAGEVERRLSEEYGPVDHRSGTILFDYTRYYAGETGENIRRIFFAFERLVDAEQLPTIKHRTNSLEASFAAAERSVARPVNLDPGYLENAKIVLASTKNFYHRTYLGRGIFGEVTLHFQNGGCRFFPWTYPDYQSVEYQQFFLETRKLYRSQLKSMCLLRRRAPEEGHGQLSGFPPIT